MRSLILQHWDKQDLPEIVSLSFANIRGYAHRMGADHAALLGFPFDKRLSAPCQKLQMLDAAYDEYDVVVMLDADMFAVKGMAEDVFALDGVGWHHQVAFTRIHRKEPQVLMATAPFWGGAIYRLTREMRQRLRKHLDDFEQIREFNTRGLGEDETIMHRAAARAGIPIEGAYIPYRWCQGNFEPHPERAAIIHMRHTIRDRPNHPGDGRDKLANYHLLKEKGILE